MAFEWRCSDTSFDVVHTKSGELSYVIFERFFCSFFLQAIAIPGHSKLVIDQDFTLGDQIARGGMPSIHDLNDLSDEKLKEFQNKKQIKDASQLVAKILLESKLIVLKFGFIIFWKSWRWNLKSSFSRYETMVLWFF